MKIKLSEILKDAKTVAIAGHIRPDGDCIGSCIGLYLYIKQEFPDVQAEVYLEEIRDSFKFLEGTDKILHSCEEDKVYDLFIALDSGDKQRLGASAKYFDMAKRTVCIDHHISNEGYAQQNFIEAEASSASELVYDILEDEKIGKNIAEALYMGIAHDTGVFQYACTSSKTMQIAGKLMDKGIAFTDILDKTYFEKTYLQYQITGRALLESIRVMDGRCIISGLRQRDIQFYGVTPTDMDGISALLRNTEGVEVAIFLYEANAQEYKVSMRSKSYIDVRKVAQFFGGGGHIRAAGCTMQGSLHDVVNNLTKEIAKQMPEEVQ